MELGVPDQNDIRSTVPSSYGLVERRREGGRNNHNGTTATPPPTTTTVLAYTQTLDPHYHHRPGGSTAKKAHERYRECLRNHAASVGGNVYDGCGEFMPGGEEGTLEALKCAACECHRNFHRKETEGETATALTHFSSRRRNANSGPNNAHAAPTMVHSLQLPAISYHRHHHQRFPAVVEPMSVAFGGGSCGGGGAESSSEELNMYQSINNVELGVAPPPPPYVLSKKRFRTKFTQEQKDKMMDFAEKIGWRINRHDDGEVERFCEEVGVRRQVFKVWMHNNKSLKKGAAQPEEEPERDQHLPA